MKSHYCNETHPETGQHCILPFFHVDDHTKHDSGVSSWEPELGPGSADDRYGSRPIDPYAFDVVY